uniref:Titin n=1 Tax=Stegastes partitus TaxID=144197 RepID=A0A3B5BAL1_9TELE
MRETTGTSWVELAATVIRTTFKAARLTTGTQYQFRVKAQNRYGIGPSIISEPVVAAYPFDVPSQPGTPVVTSFNKDAMTLSWNEPSSDGGSAILGYHVDRKEKNSILWQRISKALVVGNIFKSTGLVDGIAYEHRVIAENMAEGGIFFFRVLAENEYGVGLPAKTAEPIKISEKPQPPGKVSVIDVTHSTVTLTWEKPEHDGGSRISHYEVELAPKDSEAWSVCASVKALETVVTNLLKGEEYQFRVVAVNDKGKSDPRQLVQSVVAKDLVIEPTVRPKVSTYSVQVGHDLKIEVPIAGHPKPTITWTKDGAALKQTTRVNVTDSAHHTTLTIKDATREDGVYAENIVGIGKCSKVSEVYVARDPCYPPGRPEAVIVTRHSVKLRWTAPEYDGGSLITGYVVEKRDLPEGKWMKASFANVIEHEFTVTGLTEDSKYDFRVIARNAAGAVSKPSETTGSITAKDEVDPPKCETDPMYNQTIVINAGETFTLEASVEGKPIPTAQWFKGEVEVENSARAEIKNTDFKALLIVKDAIRVDGGQYMLVLTNVAGTKTVPFSVKPIPADSG